MLTGSDLLNKVKELGDVSKSDLVRACGYVTNKKDTSMPQPFKLHISTSKSKKVFGTNL